MGSMLIGERRRVSGASRCCIHLWGPDSLLGPQTLEDMHVKLVSLRSAQPAANLPKWPCMLMLAANAGWRSTRCSQQRLVDANTSHVTSMHMTHICIVLWLKLRTCCDFERDTLLASASPLACSMML